MDRYLGGQFPHAALFWTAFAAASAAETASSMAAHFLELSSGVGGDRTAQAPEGVTPGKMALELPTVRLRDFTTAESGIPALLCTPLSLHRASLADLAAGHSLVAALRGAGLERLFMTDWRSAAADMGFLGIDQYLADLNVLVDWLGGRVDLIGLCQGGWLALVYAARFPGKVRKLVMAGAPIDIAAGQSKLSEIATATPMIMFQSLVSLGNGRVIGRSIARFWGNDTEAGNIRESLQTLQPIGSPEFSRLEAIFRNWNFWTIDLPGTYYLEVIEKLYKRNELAGGNFVALGQKIDLSRLHLPMYLLAGSADDVVAPEQLLAVERLVATPPGHLRHEVAPCNHLALFMGRQTLEECWPRIVRWMRSTE
jgi:poly(3-hydroxybutyrate) depolymerase